MARADAIGERPIEFVTNEEQSHIQRPLASGGSVVASALQDMPESLDLSYPKEGDRDDFGCDPARFPRCSARRSP